MKNTDQVKRNVQRNERVLAKRAIATSSGDEIFRVQCLEYFYKTHFGGCHCIVQMSVPK